MPVRAENPVHGCEQRSCDASGPPVTITDHVPAVCFPSDHADGRVAAAGPTWGCVEDRGAAAPAPPARRPAAPGAAAKAGLGRPGAANGAAWPDTDVPPPQTARVRGSGDD